MARGPVRNEETTAEHVVRQIEGHEDRVAEQQLELFAAMLKESRQELEAHIAETGQARAHAAVRQVEERMSNMLDTQTATLRQALSAAVGSAKDALGKQIDDKTAAISGAFDKKLDALTPQIRDMLTTTEVTVLARLLGLIDSRLKMIEARIFGFAGPEQEREAALRKLKKVDAQVDEATQLMETGKDAMTEEGKAKDERTKITYRYLAERSYELALTQLKGAKAEADLEALNPVDPVSRLEAEALLKKITGLTAEAEAALKALKGP